jgi:hypothetical protein
MGLTRLLKQASFSNQRNLRNRLTPSPARRMVYITSGGHLAQIMARRVLTSRLGTKARSGTCQGSTVALPERKGGRVTKGDGKPEPG